MLSYFIFKGVDSRTFGIYLKAAPTIQRAKERYTKITIPGRPGELTLTEGDGIYECYTQSVTIRAPHGAEMGCVMDWLSGEGYVTFCAQPQFKQRARVISAITFDRVSYNLDWWEATVQFYCQPYKQKLAVQPLALAASAQVMNTGDAVAKPVFYVTGTGNFVLTVNGSALTLTGMTAGAVIDCDACEVTNADGTELITSISSGTFPTLAKGTNTVTWTGTGVSGVKIEKGERWL